MPTGCRVAQRKANVVAMDWSDFDADGQTTIVLSLVTRHGRTPPLLWLTVSKDELKGNRNAYEDTVLTRLSQVLNPQVKVTILADRGFGDHKLFNLLEHGLGFENVTDANGATRPSAQWVGRGGRARTLRKALVTNEYYEVGTVVCVHAKGMNEPWCLAASDPAEKTTTLINYWRVRSTHAASAVNPGVRSISARARMNFLTAASFVECKRNWGNLSFKA